jgi:hypothetical protein
MQPPPTAQRDKAVSCGHHHQWGARAARGGQLSRGRGGGDDQRCGQRGGQSVAARDAAKEAVAEAAREAVAEAAREAPEWQPVKLRPRRRRLPENGQREATRGSGKPTA